MPVTAVDAFPADATPGTYYPGAIPPVQFLLLTETGVLAIFARLYPVRQTVDQVSFVFTLVALEGLP